MKTNSNTQMGNNKNPRTVPPGNRQNKDELDSKPKIAEDLNFAP